MLSPTPFAVAATTGLLLALALVGVTARVLRSPRSTVRALARRNTPIGQIARRTGLPRDVVRTVIGTADRSTTGRQLPPQQAGSAGLKRPKLASRGRPATALRVVRASASR